MVRAAILFLILGMVAYALGSYGVAGLSVEIGKFILFIFLILSVTSFITSLFRNEDIIKPR